MTKKAKSKKLAEKVIRLMNANTLLRVISSYGRKFFLFGSTISYFEMDPRQRIWFIDSYSKKKIYLHYKYWSKGFTQGGTLHSLINYLFIYIRDGEKLPGIIFGPGVDWYCDGDLWGYGNDMEKIREKAKELKIIRLLEEKEVKNAQKS